ncbi:MAG: hypothetical protein RLY20_2850 [Verrucomicrobiota bacterium]
MNRRLTVRVVRCLTRRLDGRAFRPPDYFAQACQHLERYVRLVEKAARQEPHVYGPHADRYYRDTVQMISDEREIDAALARVYGSTPTSVSEIAARIWRERYGFSTRQAPSFRKWFRERYGA